MKVCVEKLQLVQKAYHHNMLVKEKSYTYPSDSLDNAQDVVEMRVSPRRTNLGFRGAGDIMTLGEFRKVTAEMPDDLQLIFCTGVVYSGDVIVQEEKEYRVLEVDMDYSDGEHGFLFLCGDLN